MFRGVRHKMPFFRNKDKVFIASFVPMLNPMRVNAGEYIYLKHQYPNLGKYKKSKYILKGNVYLFFFL